MNFIYNILVSKKTYKNIFFGENNEGNFNWSWSSYICDYYECLLYSVLTESGYCFGRTGGRIKIIYRHTAETKRRFVYSVVDPHYVETLYANLNNNSILDAKFAENITLKESVEYFSTSTYAVLRFWIPYSILIGFAIFGFCYLENNWLEDKKNFGY